MMFEHKAILPCCIAVAAALAASAAPGEMAVETFSAGRDGPHPGTISAEAIAGGTLLRIDLRALPQGARVYRARLFLVGPAVGTPSVPGDLDGPKVFKLTAPLEAGKPPRLAPAPLPTAAPMHDALDATAAVAPAGGGRCALLAKAVPGWDGAGALLEVAYQGRAVTVPPQVKRLKAFHRAGQTFLTWREVDPLLIDDKPVTWGRIKQVLAESPGAARYRIYAHSRRITAETLPQAELLGEVGPLSGWNVNGRSVEYAIGRAMVESDEIGELSRFSNHLINTWHMDHPRLDRCGVGRFVIDPPVEGKAGPAGAEIRPLERGVGLYVHSPARAGRRYYAVVCFRGGSANTLDFSAENSLAEPLDETVGPGEPVLQGDGLWGPYFDYPGRRKVYVQWCGPPLCPRQDMAFNWSVLVPPELTKGEKVPVELYFHRPNRSYARPRRKFILRSVQIAGHDYPFSGWHGYHEAVGTLRPRRGGVVGNHTQQRVAAFLEWAKRRLPIDPERIIAVGADGAAAMALAYPDTFAYVLISDFEGDVLGPAAAGRFAAAWGPRSPEIKDPDGRGEWGWAMLDKRIAASKADLPLWVCKGYCWGRYVRRHGRGNGPVYDAMLKARQPLLADWTWASGQLVAPDKHTALWRGLDLTRATPVPALANSSLDSDREDNGQVNLAYWWKDVADTPESFRITLVNNSRDGTVDLTPRRLARFRLRPGQRVRWQAENVPATDRRATTLPVAGGVVSADSAGRVTIPRLKIPSRTALVVKLTRAR